MGSDQQTMEMERKDSESDYQVPPIITLRRFDLSELDELMVWGCDEKVNSFSIGDPQTCKERGLRYLEKSVTSHPWFRAICLGDTPIGFVSVDQYADAHVCRALLGYLLAFDYWGKGIATQAVKMVVATAFKELPELERLEALVDVDNGASLRVLEKAGFHREGVLSKYLLRQGRSRDMVVFSFLNTDLVTVNNY